MYEYAENVASLIEAFTKAHEANFLIEKVCSENLAGINLYPLNSVTKPIAILAVEHRGDELFIDSLVVNRQSAGINGLGTYIALSAIGLARQMMPITAFTLQSQNDGGKFWPKLGFRPELGPLEGVVSNYLSFLERNGSKIPAEVANMYRQNISACMQLMQRMSVGVFDLIYDVAQQKETANLALSPEFAQAFLRARIQMRLPAKNTNACASLSQRYYPDLRHFF